MQWFTEEDRNTRFFHNVVKGRRKRLEINRIKKANGFWVEGSEMMADVVQFFMEQFTKENHATDFPLVDLVSTIITGNDNDVLNRALTVEDIKRIVFSLNGNSASGLDDFTGVFYQTCWDIVEADIVAVVIAFFQEKSLPKSITHTNLVLIPKKARVTSFSEFRPISLSNFINKIISRILHDGLERFSPNLISANQFGFLKGRSIAENVLLAQEIIGDIRNKNNK